MNKIKYFFALYDMEDNLVAICENYEELCAWLGNTTVRSVRSSVSRLSNKKLNFIVNKRDKKKYKLFKYSKG